MSELRNDLFCPECGAQGMTAWKDRAQSGRSRYRCGACGIRTTQPLYSKPQILPKAKISDIKKHRRFLITSAVNDTPLVGVAFETARRMAKELDACLLIVPGVYKNPDLVRQGLLQTYTWPAEVLPYVCDADVQLCPTLWVRGKTRIQYTAANPLQGLNHAGDSNSEIYAHPQIAMEIVATAQDQPRKMLHTTGTLSQKNYGGSPRAKKAEFHHSLGALFIEVEGSKFWPTQVRFTSNGAYLFDRFYTPRGSRAVKSIPGIVYGDTHVKFLSPTVRKLLDQVRDGLNPEVNVYHDLHDQNLGSHHNEKNALFNLRQNLKRDLSIRAELMLAVKFLEGRKNAAIVDSNHHRHLDQWFNRYKPKAECPNIDLYFELGGMVHADLAAGGDGNLFRLFVERYCGTPIKFVNGAKRFMIAGNDCSQHGDRGPNGSRGSARAFARTGNKTIIGHSHTPRIEKGCYQNGTSTLDLAYAQDSYTSWVMCHTMVYPNGKRGQFWVVENKLSPLMRQL